MKLNVRALAVALAVFWGASVLLTGAVNLLYPNYGAPFLQLLASLYPGYSGTSTVQSVLTATGYAAFDGALVGLIVGWLYNRLA